MWDYSRQRQESFLLIFSSGTLGLPRELRKLGLQGKVVNSREPAPSRLQLNSDLHKRPFFFCDLDSKAAIVSVTSKPSIYF